jgi:hypothetical protein
VGIGVTDQGSEAIQHAFGIPGQKGADGELGGESLRKLEHGGEARVHVVQPVPGNELPPGPENVSVRDDFAVVPCAGRHGLHEGREGRGCRSREGCVEGVGDLSDAGHHLMVLEAVGCQALESGAVEARLDRGDALARDADEFPVEPVLEGLAGSGHVWHRGNMQARGFHGNGPLQGSCCAER